MNIQYVYLLYTYVYMYMCVCKYSDENIWTLIFNSTIHMYVYIWINCSLNGETVRIIKRKILCYI